MCMYVCVYVHTYILNVILLTQHQITTVATRCFISNINHKAVPRPSRMTCVTDSLSWSCETLHSHYRAPCNDTVYLYVIALSVLYSLSVVWHSVCHTLQVHKAQPIRHYKPVAVKKSEVPLTVPESPNFSDRFRLWPLLLWNVTLPQKYLTWNFVFTLLLHFSFFPFLALYFNCLMYTY